MSYVGKNFIAPVMLYVKSDMQLGDASNGITASGGDILHYDTVTGYLVKTSVNTMSGNFLLIKDATTEAGEYIYVDVLVLGIGNAKVDSAEVGTIFVGTDVYVKGNKITATPTVAGDPPYGVAVSNASADEWIGVGVGIVASNIQ